MADLLAGGSRAQFFSASAPDVDFHIWVVYAQPTDAPASFVVRRWRIGGPGPRPNERVVRPAVFVDKQPWVIVPTLEEARASLPPNLTRFERPSEFDHTIVEVWL